MKTPALFVLTFIFLSTTAFAQENNTKFTLENQASILQYLDDYGLKYDKSDVATFSFFDAWGYILQTKSNEFPAAYFFNSKGENVKLKGYWCSQVLNNVDEIDDAKVRKKEENISWWLKYLTFAAEDENTSYDAYIIIAWAGYMEKDINDTSFNWYKSVKENKDLNVKVILLSYDIMDS